MKFPRPHTRKSIAIVAVSAFVALGLGGTAVAFAANDSSEPEASRTQDLRTVIPNDELITTMPVEVQPDMVNPEAPATTVADWNDGSYPGKGADIPPVEPLPAPDDVYTSPGWPGTTFAPGMDDSTPSSPTVSAVPTSAGQDHGCLD